jgi:hypothetical protein
MESLLLESSGVLMARRVLDKGYQTLRALERRVIEWNFLGESGWRMTDFKRLRCLAPQCRNVPNDIRLIDVKHNVIWN